MNNWKLKIYPYKDYIPSLVFLTFFWGTDTRGFIFLNLVFDWVKKGGVKCS
ncbi:MAG: hypothetical protein KAS66_13250 [Candidatus Omnitrophica bacterium]|nr:hypothetical protein [Candidatus Omnitrophota bacterium]